MHDEKFHENHKIRKRLKILKIDTLFDLLCLHLVLNHVN
jgi:hypothetical protein